MVLRKLLLTSILSCLTYTAVAAVGYMSPNAASYMAGHSDNISRPEDNSNNNYYYDNYGDYYGYGDDEYWGYGYYDPDYDPFFFDGIDIKLDGSTDDPNTTSAMPNVVQESNGEVVLNQ
jgi:hypothetical protein